MTILVAYHPKAADSVYYGSDCLLTNDEGKKVYCSDGKFIVRKDCIVGLSGEWSFFNILSQHPEVITPNLPKFSHRFRKLLAEYECKPKESRHGEFPFFGFSGVLITTVHSMVDIYEFNGSLTFDKVGAHQEYQNDNLFFATGSGSAYAIGAYGLTCSLNLSLPPQDLVKLTIEQAIKNDAHCGGKIIVHTLCTTHDDNK